MTFLVNVVITADTDTPRVPSDAAPKGFEVILKREDGSEVARRSDTMDLTYSFPGVAEGDYSVSAVLLDTNNVAIGETVTKAFSIRAGGTVVKTVSGLNVTFTPE